VWLQFWLIKYTFWLRSGFVIVPHARGAEWNGRAEGILVLSTAPAMPAASPACCPPALKQWLLVTWGLAGTSQHFETLWAVWTEGQGWCWCQLETFQLKTEFDSGQITGKYFSSPITGTRSESRSYTIRSSYSGAASWRISDTSPFSPLQM